MDSPLYGFNILPETLRPASRQTCYNGCMEIKEEIAMMDLLMAGLLAGCAGLVLVLLNWCHRQVSRTE